MYQTELDVVNVVNSNNILNIQKHINKSAYIESKIAKLKHTKKPNEYKDCETYVIIYVFAKGVRYSVIVDADDYYKRLRFYKWLVFGTNKNKIRVAATTQTRGVRTSVYIHQFILNTILIDHKNQNQLDNRKSNLEPSTAQKNAKNVNKIKGTVLYKGVSIVKDGANRHRPYRTRVTIYGKYVSMGYYNTSIQAAIAHDICTEELYGPDYPLNRVIVSGYNDDYKKLTKDDISLVYATVNAKLKKFKELYNVK